MQYRTTDSSDLGPIYTGRKVFDAHGLALGTITDVVYADGEYEPQYLVVDPGMLRRSHYVPTAGAAQTDTGDIVVAWDREWFRLSPPASGRPVLTGRQRRDLAVHYAAR
ncbi:MAG: PRC-barrel domain-containing protein [Ilumatobacter fluminis]|uniref:PRC-barrel domain-containing protein n=1 Tax=Ilumatobacter fluminis TaxID=467091 RepID=UPI0032EDB731